jgi:hypothetical protein
VEGGKTKPLPDWSSKLPAQSLKYGCQIKIHKTHIYTQDYSSACPLFHSLTCSSGVENVNPFRNARGIVSSSTSKTLQKKTMTVQIRVFQKE